MNTKTKFLLILFVVAPLLYLFGTTALFSYQNQIIKSQIPVWNGEHDKPNQNYIIEGTIISYDQINRVDYTYLNTDYGIVQVSVSFLKNDIFYKRCSYNIGDKVRYAGVFSEKYNFSTYFVLKRELC